jgi:hypothetical protein
MKLGLSIIVTNWILHVFIDNFVFYASYILLLHKEVIKKILAAMCKVFFY